MLEVIDNAFNQKWCKELIGKFYCVRHVPSYVNVREVNVPAGACVKDGEGCALTWTV